MKDIVSEQESLFQSLTTETQRCIWHKVILKYFVFVAIAEVKVRATFY